MNSIGQRRLKDILELVRTAYSTPNQDVFRNEILNALIKTLQIDKAIFIIRDKDFKYTDFMAKNIEEKYVCCFKDYYHQYDPFNLISGAVLKKSTVHLKQLVSYPSFLRTEYYNDFLRPQQIYHKIMVYLGSKEKLQGMIALFRPQGSLDFAEEEVAMLRAIAPYIKDALNSIELRKNLELEKNVFDAVVMSMPNSILVFDTSMKLLHMNRRAEELCRTLNGCKAGVERPFIPQVLLEDCYALRGELEEHPYSIASYNNSVFIDGNGKKGKDEIKGLMDYYKEDVKDEKNIQLLSDDYAKFIRFCHWKIDQVGKGIMGLITKNTYINTSAFKGLRKKMLQSFDKVYVYNLHGKLYEKAPDGGKDQNVFDIRVGTAILLGVKTGKKKDTELANLYYAELFGDRNCKYEFLEKHNINDTQWEQLNIDPTYFFFEKKIFNEAELYSSFWAVDEIFNDFISGVQTGKDHFVLGDNEKELKNRLNAFIWSNLPIELIEEAFKIKDQAKFKIKKIKESFKSIDQNKIESYSFKPFYTRKIYYDTFFLRRDSYKVMKNLKEVNNNIALVLKKSSTDLNYNSAFCSQNITDLNFLGGQSYVFPLWIYEGEGGLLGASKKSNIQPDFEQTIEKHYKKTDLTESIFYYIYALLYCPKYRKGFAEQLQIDYPKIPFTADFNLFKILSDIGKTLVELHLLTSKELTKPQIKFNGKGDNKVTEIDFRETEEQLYINETQYFSGIKKAMWEWEVGKNKPIQRWIKNAKGKELGLNETIEFGKICSAIKLTFDKQAEVDEHYEDILKDLMKR